MNIPAQNPLHPVSGAVAPDPHRPAYVGRFAPSPSGELHAGSLVAALASYLDARAHQGRWLLRIEDTDTQRNTAGASASILASLQALGFEHDGEIIYQHQRTSDYQQALDQLIAQGDAFGCTCSRREIALAAAACGRTVPESGEIPYPGTCRNGIAAGRQRHAWRLRIAQSPIRWRDRSDTQDRLEYLEQQCGDFVLRRADGIWAYQLAVVVDDGFSGITHVVRGADLLDSTARQIYLQRRLLLPTPSYLHIPVVRAADGGKLSKQNGARPIDLQTPVAELRRAAEHLGLGPIAASSLAGFWAQAPDLWRARCRASGWTV